VDFAAHYAGGSIALDGAWSQLYSPDHQHAVQMAFIPGAPPDFLDLYLSPPFVALLYAPFAVLPYLPATLLWTVVSLGLVAASVALLVPATTEGPASWRSLALAVAAFPPLMEAIAVGQDTGLSLLLFVVGYRLLSARRPAWAGAVLGLGAFKPQLFVLMPVLLLFRRQGRAFVAFAAVATALFALSWWLVGTEGLHVYVALLRSGTYRHGITAQYGWKMLGAPAIARGLLPPGAEDLGGMLGAIASLAVVGVFGRACLDPRGEARLPLLYGLAVLGGIASSPHVLIYDGLLVVVPAALSVGRWRTAPRPLFIVGYAVAWMGPVIGHAFASNRWPWSLLALPWGAVAVAAFFGAMAREIRAPA
jgi:hypothetical protein